jgi:hypothetical protein
MPSVQLVSHSSLTRTGFCSERRLIGSNTMGFRIRFSSLQGPGASKRRELVAGHPPTLLCKERSYDSQPPLDRSLCAEGRHAGELERLHEALCINGRPHIVALQQ